MKITKGNSKLGPEVHTIGLVPGRDCPGSCDGCRHTCYALKAWRMYPSVRTLLTDNSTEAHRARRRYFAGIDSYLSEVKPKFFRWHWAGDILDKDYLSCMYRIARNHPYTRFLAYTKTPGLDFRGRPANLTIYASVWPGQKLPSYSLPRAYMQDGTEHRVPSTAFECNGGCKDCGYRCWDGSNDVVFHKH